MTKSDQAKTPTCPPPDRDWQEFLNEYTGPARRRRGWVVSTILLAALVLLGVDYWRTVARSVMSPEEVAKSIEFFQIDSQWVVKEKVVYDDFNGVILVPQVSFRMRNVGRREIQYMYLLGVFRFFDNGKTIGEGYQMTLKEPLPPGGESGLITLTSGFGYRGSSASAFEKYRKDWRDALVDLFAKARNSKMVPLKTFYIARRIGGQPVEVQIERPKEGEKLP